MEVHNSMTQNINQSLSQHQQRNETPSLPRTSSQSKIIKKQVRRRKQLKIIHHCAVIFFTPSGEMKTVVGQNVSHILSKKYSKPQQSLRKMAAQYDDQVLAKIIDKLLDAKRAGYRDGQIQMSKQQVQIHSNQSKLGIEMHF